MTPKLQRNEKRAHLLVIAIYSLLILACSYTAIVSALFVKGIVVTKSDYRRREWNSFT